MNVATSILGFPEVRNHGQTHSVTANGDGKVEQQPTLVQPINTLEPRLNAAMHECHAYPATTERATKVASDACMRAMLNTLNGIRSYRKTLAVGLALRETSMVSTPSPASPIHERSYPRFPDFVQRTWASKSYAPILGVRSM